MKIIKKKIDGGGAEECKVIKQKTLEKDFKDPKI